MCNFASFVITKGPKVWWLPKSDSHEKTIREYKLNADGARGPNVVRVEIVPKNGNLSLPLRTWEYKLDQDTLPSWYGAEECERACRVELKKLAKTRLTGWNVKEAFNPVNPLLLPTKKMSKDKLLVLLKDWTSVRDSVWTSVRDSVWDSVWASVVGVSVRASVWDSVGVSVRASVVRASVWCSVWASVWDSVRDSVRASVGDSVWASVGDSVRAYIGGLFPNIKEWKYAEKLGPDPWRHLRTLWYAGYVPSFDGTTWRLHTGKKARVVLEWNSKTDKAKSFRG